MFFYGLRIELFDIFEFSIESSVTLDRLVIYDVWSDE